MAALGTLTVAAPALGEELCPSSVVCIADSVRNDGNLMRVSLINNCGYTVKIAICFQLKGQSAYLNCKSAYYVEPGETWEPWATHKRNTGSYNFAATRQLCRASLHVGAGLKEGKDASGMGTVKQGKPAPPPPPPEKTDLPAKKTERAEKKPPKRDDEAIVGALIPKQKAKPEPGTEKKKAGGGSSKSGKAFERGLLDADKRSGRTVTKRTNGKKSPDPLLAWRKREEARCRAARKTIRVGYPKRCTCVFELCLTRTPSGRTGSAADRARARRAYKRLEAKCKRDRAARQHAATVKQAAANRQVKACLARVASKYKEKLADRIDGTVKFD